MEFPPVAPLDTVVPSLYSSQILTRIACLAIPIPMIPIPLDDYTLPIVLKIAAFSPCIERQGIAGRGQGIVPFLCQGNVVLVVGFQKYIKEKEEETGNVLLGPLQPFPSVPFPSAFGTPLQSAFIPSLVSKLFPLLPTIISFSFLAFACICTAHFVFSYHPSLALTFFSLSLISFPSALSSLFHTGTLLFFFPYFSTFRVFPLPWFSV